MIFKRGQIAHENSIYAAVPTTQAAHQPTLTCCAKATTTTTTHPQRQTVNPPTSQPAGRQLVRSSWVCVARVMVTANDNDPL